VRTQRTTTGCLSPRCVFRDVCMYVRSVYSIPPLTPLCLFYSSTTHSTVSILFIHHSLHYVYSIHPHSLHCAYSIHHSLHCVVQAHMWCHATSMPFTHCCKRPQSYSNIWYGCLSQMKFLTTLFNVCCDIYNMSTIYHYIDGGKKKEKLENG